MAAERQTIAIFPGTFDPVTLGHTDLITRASRLFHRIVIGVGHNPEKSAMFSTQERVEMISEIDSWTSEIDRASSSSNARIRALPESVALMIVT